jgi:hypothetical protein
MKCPRPKFADCKTCVFFLRNRVNPICKECDSGEFYEERVRVREKTKHELMELFGEYHDDE